VVLQKEGAALAEGIRRRIRHRVAIVALAFGVCAAGVSSKVSSEGQHRYRNAAPVCVDFTAKDHLSGPAFVTMREEATRIWLRHGIALTWTQHPRAECQTVVPIVFDAEQLTKLGREKYADALAVTIFSGSSRVVYVSAPRAFRMLGQLPEVTRIESLGERDLRGGLLMGRVVAHELGHVLLTTLAHSQTGLMRPVFGLRDVLSADDRMTDLSPVETDRLAMRFSLMPLESPREARAVAPRDR